MTRVYSVNRSGNRYFYPFRRDADRRAKHVAKMTLCGHRIEVRVHLVCGHKPKVDVAEILNGKSSGANWCISHATIEPGRVLAVLDGERTSPMTLEQRPGNYLTLQREGFII